MFSSRLGSDLSPSRLHQELIRQRTEGAALIDLTSSNPAQCGLGPEAELLAQALTAPGAAEYHPEPRGLRRTRQAVAAYYVDRGLPTSPEQIFLSASTSQSYAELIKLFADPGNEIIVPQPSYPLFDMLVTLEGCRPVPCPTIPTPEGLWRMDEAALERAFTSRTRAVILVSPNNPTGIYLNPSEVAAAQRMCTEHGVPLILDEVFSDYAAEGIPSPTAIDNDTGLAVRLSGLSKVVGAPQLKLAWMRLSGEPALVHTACERMEFVVDVYLSASTPAQLAAEVLLPQRGPVQARIRARLEANQRTAEHLLRSGPARLLPRRGGWHLVVRLPDGEDEEGLALDLLAEDHVVVHPGYFYDFPSGEHLVVSLIPPSDTFTEGMRRLAARLEARLAAVT